MPESPDIVRRSPSTWLVPLLVVAVGLAFTTAHVPSRARLLVLFPVAFGLTIGVVSGFLAKTYLVSNRRVVAGMTFMVALLAVFGGLVESHRTWAKAARGELEQSLEGQRRDAGQAAVALAPPSPTERRAIDEATSFGTYLVRRVTQLGRWPVWGAVAFAVGETLLAALAAAFVAWRVSADPGHVSESP